MFQSTSCHSSSHPLPIFSSSPPRFHYVNFASSDEIKLSGDDSAAPAADKKKDNKKEKKPEEKKQEEKKADAAPKKKKEQMFADQHLFTVKPAKDTIFAACFAEYEQKAAAAA